MRLLFIFLLAIIGSVPQYGFALESRCFTDYGDIVADGASQVFVSTEEREDLFFTQDGQMIPSQIKSVRLRDGFSYKLSSNISHFPLDGVHVLTDDISSTQIEVSPLMAPDGFELVLSFGDGLQKGSFIPYIDISSKSPYATEISDDGVKYVQIHASELHLYSFHFLRFVFKKTEGAQSSIFLRTLRFDQKSKDIYVTEPVHYGQITAYRGWICDASKLSALIAQRYAIGKDIDTSREVKTPLLLNFSTLPTKGLDSDNDTIIDMRDNCSSVVNLDQSDRNHDGIGDACSDDDSDGVRGNADNCPTVANRDQKDLNANGIGDACEFDTDKDGVSDGIDNCIHVVNLDQLDTDGDAIGNACDNCDLYNPDQLDFNKNTLGDVCEQAAISHKNNDSDGDDVENYKDNCPKLANPDQFDTDRDSIGDACDNCISIKNPDQSDENKNGKGEMCEDADNDGIDGWRDNCISIKNPDQADNNNDGVGNACSDTDTDGIYDEVDNCPAVSNSDQKDIDKDTIGNMCDDKDNRLLESNRTVFMVLFGLIACLFIGGIIYFIRKLKL